MRASSFVCVMVVGLAPGFLAQSGHDPNTVKALTVTICDLAAQPQKYENQIVAFRGSISKGWTRSRKPVHEFTVSEPWAEARCPGTRVLVIVREESSGLLLAQDDSFSAFQKALRERTHIEATFEGRIDAINTKGHAKPVRLILRRIAQLDVRPSRSVDR